MRFAGVDIPEKLWKKWIGDYQAYLKLGTALMEIESAVGTEGVRELPGEVMEDMISQLKDVRARIYQRSVQKLLTYGQKTLADPRTP
jgi:hypothetical protein